MCGILTHLAFDEGARIDGATLAALNQLLVHRGPDSGGVFLKDEIALAIRRLAIIDLKGGDQPITSADGRYVIVFNGEIYNHEDLRTQLVRNGHHLKTRSDTETLLYMYIERGPQCLNDLNGMFAFAIWDNLNRELFVARDRMGIKPLYYAMDGKRVMFSSELTPFYRSGFFPLRWNTRAVSDYLAYWYVCEPNTVFENVYQLPPGTYAIVRQGRMEQHRYWTIPAEAESPMTFGDAVEQLRALLEDATRIRMKVDVPIGTFLSGGIDSGLVTAIASQCIGERLTSFSIGFKEKTYSELNEARQTAGRYGVELVHAMMEDITPEMFETVAAAFDEPLGNASYLPTYFLAKAARERVKVVLTGDGGDELFGGYPTYQAPYYQAMARCVPPFMMRWAGAGVRNMPVSHERISLDFRLKQLMRGISLDYRRAHYTWREVTPLALQQRLFRREIGDKLASYDPFSVAEHYFQRAGRLGRKNQLMYVDLNTYLLNDHLRKVDRMTMAHSLEARLPYLDYRIVELAMRMPEDFKATLWETKRVLKAIARERLPRRVVDGKKKGLTSPIAGWLSDELKNYAADALCGGLMAELFDESVIRSLLEEHWARTHDHSRTLWGLLTLQVWGKRVRHLETAGTH